jgi:hypothetical protein
VKLSRRLSRPGIGCLLGTPARLNTGGQTAALTRKMVKMMQAAAAAPSRRNEEVYSNASGGQLTRDVQEIAHRGAGAVRAPGKVAGTTAEHALQAQLLVGRGSAL